MQKLKSLRHKFVRTMLLVAGSIGAASFAIVTVTNIQTSAEHLAAIRTHIQDGITGKGKVLTQNHALALRSLTLDNAFVDMQRLVDRAVEENADVVYGIFVGAGKTTLAYAEGTAGAPNPVNSPGAAGSAASAKAKPPEKLAFLKLGLTENDVLAPKELVTKKVVRGEEVVEVSEPVTGDDGELLGTVRYGLSTRRMREGLAIAKAESDAGLRRSLMLIGSLVGLTTLLGLLLSRVQAVRITQPVTELTLASNSFATGNRAIRVNVSSGDELELLGSSFNRMVEDLNASYQDLERMNQTLEKKVEERTSELGNRNRDMRLVLDNVDQGFVTLSPLGVMASERSQVVHTWFGSCDASITLSDYLKETSPEFSLEFQCSWDQVADGILPPTVAVSQLPQRLSKNGRTWSFRYLPYFRADEELDGVLVVIAEITERLLREREDARQHELMQSFKHLVQDRTGFTAFQRETSRAVRTICGRTLEPDLTQVKRLLHTLKGNAGLMGLTVVARMCHEIEDQMSSGDAPDGKLLVDLSARWTEISTHLAEMAGGSTEPRIEVPEGEYTAFMGKLTRGIPLREVQEQMRAWQLEPVERALGRLGEQAKGLAVRMGRGDIDVKIEGHGVRLDNETWAPFFGDLVHVVRNAVDHGLETEDERLESGKGPGLLTFVVRASAKVLEFEMGDNGKGIAWEAIANKARARGLPADTEADLVEALFCDGVSSKEESTEISGRGVGMGALRQTVEAMNGRLTVKSVRGKGTTWTFRFASGPASPAIAAKPQASEPPRPSA